MDIEILKEKIKEGYTIKKLSNFFEVSEGKIRYNLTKFGLNTSGYKRTHNWTKENLLNAISKSECKSDVLRNLNITLKSGNFQTLDKYCLLYGIDVSILKYKYNRGNKYSRILTNNEIFILNSSVSKNVVKKRIIQDKLLSYKCSNINCSIIDIWCGNKIKLEIDHINGDNSDNRLENLRYLCPNCHSQTKTHCIGHNRLKIKYVKIEKLNEDKILLNSEKLINNARTNKQIESSTKLRKVKDRPSKEILLKEVDQLGYSATGRKYGVSDNAIRKWLK
jgi:Zn finger protein HypA/HybF involved in hydrogenase expression